MRRWGIWLALIARRHALAREIQRIEGHDQMRDPFEQLGRALGCALSALIARNLWSPESLEQAWALLSPAAPWFEILSWATRSGPWVGSFGALAFGSVALFGALALAREALPRGIQGWPTDLPRLRERLARMDIELERARLGVVLPVPVPVAIERRRAPRL